MPPFGPREWAAAVGGTRWWRARGGRLRPAEQQINTRARTERRGGQGMHMQRITTHTNNGNKSEQQ